MNVVTVCTRFVAATVIRSLTALLSRSRAETIVNLWTKRWVLVFRKNHDHNAALQPWKASSDNTRRFKSYLHCILCVNNCQWGQSFTQSVINRERHWNRLRGTMARYCGISILAGSNLCKFWGHSTWYCGTL